MSKGKNVPVLEEKIVSVGKVRVPVLGFEDISGAAERRVPRHPPRCRNVGAERAALHIQPALPFRSRKALRGFKPEPPLDPLLGGGLVGPEVHGMFCQIGMRCRIELGDDMGAGSVR